MIIRKLPCTCTSILDKFILANNMEVFNPSKAGDWIYLRNNKKVTFTSTSSILLYNDVTCNYKIIESPLHMMEETQNLYKGLEDLRLCTYMDRIWFTCTSTHLSKNMTNEMGVGYFDKDLNKVEVIEKLDICDKHVKNITPFVHKDCLLLLDTYTMTVYKLAEDFNISKYITLDIVSDIKYKGSTSPIHLHGSIYGCVVHDTIHLSKWEKISYLHYWLEFNIDLGIVTFVSAPFLVLVWGLEFISGIDKKESSIYLYMGLNDKKPIRIHTTLSNLRVGRIQRDEAI